MSKTAVALKKAASEISATRHPISANRKSVAGEYSELIRRLFYSHSAVAIVACDAAPGSPAVCEGIACELAASGKCVVIVPVDALLRMDSMPPAELSACQPGKVADVWLWPSSGPPVGLVRPPFQASTAGAWLDSLRHVFDSVVLDCPGVEAAPATIELAALADAVVLVVEAGRTPKQQIRRDQNSLQSSGVKLAGCILTART
jgi:hypothetical protein